MILTETNRGMTMRDEIFELTDLELEAVSGGAGFWQSVKQTIEIQAANGVDFGDHATGSAGQAIAAAASEFGL